MRIFIVVAILLLLSCAPLLLRFRPRWVAAFNLAVTNRVTGPFAGWLPGFGIVTHIGRRSRRRFHTPVNVFRTAGGFLIALTYGPNSQWVQNVLANGEAEIQTRGKQYRLSAPTVMHDPTHRQFPFPVRIVLRVIGANDFLRVSASKGNGLPEDLPHRGSGGEQIESSSLVEPRLGLEF
jgi:deazaflavin-dependent oxidoreductase (nitroreductase family)